MKERRKNEKPLTKMKMKMIKKLYIYINLYVKLRNIELIQFR